MSGSHSVFLIFLTIITLLAAAAIGIRGWGYYVTPIDQRPFRPDYGQMKPSGTYSHGLGIIGATMIIVGVSTYSTRKRVRSLWNLGNLSRWLEFHICLCLLGPVLIVYHTTFKAGGIAAISLWTMLSVAASGIIGRFLYVQIPRNMKGAQLTAEDVQAEIDRLGLALQTSVVGVGLRNRIDDSFVSLRAPRTFFETMAAMARLERARFRTNREIRRTLSGPGLTPEVVHRLREAASQRASLMRKSLALGQVERLFFYWHAIHLPFSIIMFITLAAHVTVSILLGYRWIF